MLTHRDLKAIQEGNRRHPDVMELLREVKRLRNLAALTYSVLGHMPTHAAPERHWDTLGEIVRALQAEPAVIESERMRKKREELEFRRKVAMEQRTCADASVKNTTTQNTSSSKR